MDYITAIDIKRLFYALFQKMVFSSVDVDWFGNYSINSYLFTEKCKKHNLKIMGAICKHLFPRASCHQ